ncbi:5-carboxymethyl-2-hydroxymuconate Delta-isomerase [Chromobacterium vaccinii]|uniref:5-carboxymethyl-2-hydroxymuconate Delta-isomerase n=1 Tax=Chromobacterium vaccinii TaxID=1108595 RepID=UPI001E2D98C3|nr:5-carboxymethyl-2-hydroxymuconate Delta-isomerase [Chromobacterium vaccinii]MCD4485942.1 5-carboxymethyl-2-hydroxymuconate Delta-isomerase [Chromobacterium vaccinii]
MPHCVIECSAEIAGHPDIDRLLHAVHEAADASGLFQSADIKVRLQSYDDFLVGGRDQDFVHIACHILAGRDDDQKGQLADQLVRAVCERLPGVQSVSCEVRDMAPAAYSRRDKLRAVG